MTDEQASAHVEKIHAALVIAELRHPDSLALPLLHRALADAWADFHADHPGVVQPFDGTNKP